ncbi:MAG: FKBP-type peptidyl-prolyl cis-trans isomerase [Pirellulales bacterium]
MKLFQQFFQRQFEQRQCERRRRSTRSSHRSFENLEPRLAFDVDLSVVINNGQNTYVPGSDKVDTVIVQNFGSDAVTNARVIMPLADGILSATWVGQGPDDSTVPTSGNSNGIDAMNAFISLPAGGSAIFTVTNQIAADAIGQLRTEVTAVTPLGVEDSDPNNNSAFDINVRPFLAVGSGLAYLGTPTVSIVDPASGTVVRQFDVYEQGFMGGVQTAIHDVDNDGRDDVVVAPGRGRVGEIRVFDIDGEEMPEYRITPFGSSFLSGVNIALGDVNGDGTKDLIAGQAAGSTVSIHLGGSLGWESTSFRRYTPYGTTHLAGVSVAAADIGTITNGSISQTDSKDGRAELVLGTGPGAIKSVQIVDVAGAPKVVTELSIDPTIGYSGVTIASGLYNDRSVDDIMVSGGQGDAARVDMFQITRDSGSTLTTKENLTSGNTANSRFRVSPLDSNGDGQVNSFFAVGAGGAQVLDAEGNVTNTVSVVRGPLTAASASSASIDPAVIRTSSGLQYVDLVVGLGVPVTAGQTVSVHYVGSRQNGDVFDTSLTRGTPFEFTLGQGDVIQGWDEGVAGMREGGRRRLIIPADMAYGENPGRGRPGGTLVFDVQLLSASNPGLGERPPVVRDPLIPN